MSSAEGRTNKRMPEAANPRPPASDEDYALRARICRVLGHPRRLQILELLAGGEMANSALLARLAVGKVSLSQHLALLRSLGVVRSRKRGREVFHSLVLGEVNEVSRALRTLASACS